MNEIFKNVGKRKNSLLLMLLGLALGMYFFVFKVIGYDFAFFPGDLGDGRLNLYFLEHAYQFFTGKVSSFWDAPFMYPEKNVIAYSDNLLGSSPFYMLFRLLGCDNFLAYQCWFIVISALNYVGAFYLFKYLFKNNYSAVLGAFVFAFSIALQSQLTHAQVFPRFAIPLSILMAIKFSEYLKPHYFFLAILFLVYQIYCGIYLGFMLVIPLGFYLVLILLKQFVFAKASLPNKTWYVKMVLSVIINGLILLPLMLPYMARKMTPSLQHYWQIFPTIPTLKSHFYSKQGSLFWDFLCRLGENYSAPWDHQIFAGGVATLCLLLCFFWVAHALVKIKFNLSKLSNLNLLLIAGFFTFVFYLRFSNISAYLFIYVLPGFSSMRSITRIINIELLFFALSTALVFVKLSNHYSKNRLIIFLIFLFIIVADNYFGGANLYRTKVSIAKERTGKYDSIFSSIPFNSVVSFEPSKLESASIYYHIDGMLISQKFGLNIVNGYTATCPADYGMFWRNPSESARNIWLADKQFMQDTLFVISNTQVVEKVAKSEIQNEEHRLNKDKIELLNQINYIKSDKQWMEKIEEKALEKNVSVDSMVVIDAQWLIDNK